MSYKKRHQKNDLPQVFQRLGNSSKTVHRKEYKNDKHGLRIARYNDPNQQQATYPDYSKISQLQDDAVYYSPNNNNNNNSYYDGNNNNYPRPNSFRFVRNNDPPIERPIISFLRDTPPPTYFSPQTWSNNNEIIHLDETTDEEEQVQNQNQNQRNFSIAKKIQITTSLPTNTTEDSSDIQPNHNKRKITVTPSESSPSTNKKFRAISPPLPTSPRKRRRSPSPSRRPHRASSDFDSDEEAPFFSLKADIYTPHYIDEDQGSINNRLSGIKKYKDLRSCPPLGTLDPSAAPRLGAYSSTHRHKVWLNSSESLPPSKKFSPSSQSVSKNPISSPPPPPMAKKLNSPAIGPKKGASDTSIKASKGSNTSIKATDTSSVKTTSSTKPIKTSSSSAKVTTPPTKATSPSVTSSTSTVNTSYSKANDSTSHTAKAPKDTVQTSKAASATHAHDPTKVSAAASKKVSMSFKKTLMHSGTATHKESVINGDSNQAIPTAPSNFFTSEHEHWKETHDPKLKSEANINPNGHTEPENNSDATPAILNHESVHSSHNTPTAPNPVYAESSSSGTNNSSDTAQLVMNQENAATRNATSSIHTSVPATVKHGIEKNGKHILQAKPSAIQDDKSNNSSVRKSRRVFTDSPIQDNNDQEKKKQAALLEKNKALEKERIEKEIKAKEENERRAKERRLEDERKAKERRLEDERKAKERQLEDERKAKDKERKAKEQLMDKERKAKEALEERDRKAKELLRQLTIDERDDVVMDIAPLPRHNIIGSPLGFHNICKKPSNIPIVLKEEPMDESTEAIVHSDQSNEITENSANMAVDSPTESSNMNITESTVNSTTNNSTIEPIDNSTINNAIKSTANNSIESVVDDIINSAMNSPILSNSINTTESIPNDTSKSAIDSSLTNSIESAVNDIIESAVNNTFDFTAKGSYDTAVSQDEVNQTEDAINKSTRNIPTIVTEETALNTFLNAPQQLASPPTSSHTEEPSSTLPTIPKNSQLSELNTKKRKGRVPRPWKTVMTESGDIYYHNSITGEISQERPVA